MIKKEIIEIRNKPKITNKLIQAIRELLEHRAAWLYLLIDEAEKRGISTEDFAKSAIMRCGCFQGNQLTAKASTKSLKGCFGPCRTLDP